MNQSYINKGMYVDNTLNVNTLNVTDTSNFSGKVSAQNMLNIEGNTSVATTFDVKGSAMFSKGFSSSNTLNLNNNKIINVSNASSGSDLANINSLIKYQPQYYSYQSNSIDYQWNVGSSFPWNSNPASFIDNTPNYSNYFSISDTNLLLATPGLYNLSIYVYKIGGGGNGYGGHLEVLYTDAWGSTTTLGWMYMWNEDGQNFPGSLVDLAIPVQFSGSVNISLIDQGYFKVQFFSFQLIYYPTS